MPYEAKSIKHICGRIVNLPTKRAAASKARIERRKLAAGRHDFPKGLRFRSYVEIRRTAKKARFCAQHLVGPASTFCCVQRETPSLQCSHASHLFRHPRTLFDKIWDAHIVTRSSDDCLLYVDEYVLHEGSTPLAFSALRLFRSPTLPRLPTCGQLPTDESRRGGNFVRPVIFTGLDNRSRLAQEEIFGPVVCVMPFDTPEEAIAVADDSSFGWLRASGLAFMPVHCRP
jgi:hypothetical protein